MSATAGTFLQNATQNHSEATISTHWKQLPAMIVSEIVITAFGVLGNTLILLVVLGKRFRDTAFGLHLLWLSLFDTGSLITQNVMSMRFNKSSSLFGCKMVMYINTTCEICSSWTLVIIAVERALAVCIPHKTIIFNSRKRAMISQICVSLSIAAICSYILLSSNMSKFDQPTICSLQKPSVTVALVSHLLYDLIIHSFLPACLLVILNTIVIIAVKRSSKFREVSSSKTRETDTNTRLNILLISTSVVYTATTLPIAIALLVRDVCGPDWDVNDQGELIIQLLYKLHKLNHATNFLVYIAFGSEFRAGLKELFIPVKNCINRCRT